MLHMATDSTEKAGSRWGWIALCYAPIAPWPLPVFPGAMSFLQRLAEQWSSQYLGETAIVTLQTFAWSLRLLYLPLFIYTAVVLIRGKSPPEKAVLPLAVVFSAWLVLTALPVGLLPTGFAVALSALLLGVVRRVLARRHPLE